MSRTLHLQLLAANVKTVWERCALWSAVSAGVFTVVVSIILFGAFLDERRESPVDVRRIAELKTKLIAAPEDERVKQEIREIDLRVRRDYFRRRTFVVRGAWLLTAGVGVMLICLKAAAELAATPYLPPVGATPERDGAGQQRAVTRGVVAGVVTFAGLALAMPLLYRPQIPGPVAAKADEPAPTAASAEPDLNDDAYTAQWPGFRGPGGYGYVPARPQAYPTNWHGANGGGILWKSPVPLPGNNSPVVWGEHVFVAGATKDRREVYCFDAGTGALRWRHAVNSSAPAPEVHDDAGYACATMATDGRRAFALFATGDLACIDFAGKQLWTRNLGSADNTYGITSCLLAYGGRVIVQYDQNPQGRTHRSALLAFDAKTGNPAWQARRPVEASWASPILARASGGAQVVTVAPPLVMAHDPKDGRELWRAGEVHGEIAPSPAFGNDLVLAVDEAGITALRTGGSGNVSTSHVAWKFEEEVPDIVSPVSDGKLAYVVGSLGYVTCLDVSAGTMLWQHDFASQCRASPVIVGDAVYLVNADGVLHVFKSDRQFHELGKLELGEATVATPALGGGRIYVRALENLYCIGGAE